VYREEKRSKKAARRLVFIVIGVFVALASTAMVAFVILMSSDAEAREPIDVHQVAQAVVQCDQLAG